MPRLAPISRPRPLRSIEKDIEDAPDCHSSWLRVFRALDRAEKEGEQTGDWTAFRAIAIPLAARYHTDDYCGEKQVDDQLLSFRNRY